MSTTDAILIHPMTPTEIDGCGSLIDAIDFFRDYGPSPQGIRDQLRAHLGEERQVMLTAHHQGQLVGFAWFALRGAFERSGYLRLLAVLPDSQRLGAGRKLMEALEQEHLTSGGVTLLVTASNAKARAFYHALGYRQVGLLEGYLREGYDECIYFKPSPR